MYLEVEFFTLDHVIRGFMDTKDERISDALNDKKLTSVFMSDVQMARLTSVGKIPPLKLAEISVEKIAILMAMPVEQDITHKSLFRRSARQVHRLMVSMPNFELNGSIHLTERLDITRVLITRPETFIPVTDAVATYVLNPQVAVQASTIVFNKNQVQLLGVKEPPKLAT